MMENPATGVNEAGLTIGPISTAGSPTTAGLDAAVDAVTDLNDGISEDAGWTVVEHGGVNDTGQVIGFGTAVIVVVSPGLVGTGDLPPRRTD